MEKDTKADWILRPVIVVAGDAEDNVALYAVDIAAAKREHYEVIARILFAPRI